MNARLITERVRSLPATSLPALPILVLAIWLKYHFSQAGSQDLSWILAPLAWLVELGSGLSFQAERGIGYTSSDGLIVIAPACAGINFMITALLTGAGTVMAGSERIRTRIIGMAVVAVSAYILTLMVNALRIILAVELFGLDIYQGPLTKDRVHRILGIFLYFPSLLTYGLLLRTVLTKPPQNLWLIPVLSLTCYLGITVGIPILTGSFQQAGSQFAEHALSLIIGGCIIFGLYFLVFNRKVRIRSLAKDQTW